MIRKNFKIHPQKINRKYMEKSENRKETGGDRKVVVFYTGRLYIISEKSTLFSPLHRSLQK